MGAYSFFTPDTLSRQTTGYRPAAGRPRVLILGDSISIDYTPIVVQRLADRAMVMRPDDNCGDTPYGLEKIHEWLGETQWDLVHFNWGLHDLCYRHPDSTAYGHRDKEQGKLSVSLSDYRKNLSELTRLIHEASHAQVFATTTVVPPGEVGRFAGDEIRYNAVACEVMHDQHIPVNDLHAVTAKFPNDLFREPGDVHFSPTGSEHLAEHVIACVLRHLSTHA